MSGAADDDSAPSTSTPQSPEGTEGAPDVTVTESKPDTPGSHVEEEDASKDETKNETPTEPANEDVETVKADDATPTDNAAPADEESKGPACEENAENKEEAVDEAAKAEDASADGETVQGDQQETPSVIEEKGEPAPETGETEPVRQDDAEAGGQDNEAQLIDKELKENNTQDDVEDEQAKEPAKEDGETDGMAVSDVSAKDEEKADDVGSVDQKLPEIDRENVADTGAEEDGNAQDNVTDEQPTQNTESEAPTDIPESDTRETKSNEDGNPQETENPTEASNNENTENEAISDSSEGKNNECAKENAESNQEDTVPTVDTNTSEAPSNARESEGHVELSEVDSVKLENKNLKGRVKELEEEIDRIKEGRKEGIKIQAAYLAREVSQQQDTEKYLREKLAENLQEKEESEQRVRDLQLRLKRFAKDDQAKDARLAKMEKELREVTHEVQILENMLDEETLRSIQEQRSGGQVNGPSGGGRSKGTSSAPPPQSKTCIIL